MFCRICAIVITGLTTTGMPVLLTAAQAVHTRVIPYGFGASIEKQLRPDDDVVVVSRPREGVVFSPTPSPEELIRYEVGLSDLVVVLNLTNVSPLLVDDGNWINTRLIGTLTTVLFDERRPVAAGRSLEVQTMGGELRIGKTLVRAWEPPHVEIGHQYLLFAAVNADTLVLQAIYQPLRIDGDLLIATESVSNELANRDLLDHYSLRRLTVEVRSVAKQSKTPSR